MGEIAEWMFDQAMEQALELNQPMIDWDDLLESRTWLTARRVRIPISEMQTSHIKNTLRCLKGESRTKIPHQWNGKTHERWIELLTDELSKR